MPFRLGTNRIGRLVVGEDYDADAKAFLTATGITDATITSAINTLVTDLKGYGLWTKFNAIYPMVGGTSTTCKYNLIDPRDLDAAFRLTFNGTITYTSTGITSDGTSGYAQTHLVPNTTLSLDNTHISAYVRTVGATINDVEMGIQGGTDGLFIAPYYAPGLQNFRAVNSSQIGPSTLGTTIPAFYQANRISSTTSKQYRNGSILNTDAASSETLSVREIYLLSYHSTTPGSPAFISGRENAFASIGEGMTDGEATNFYTAVQTFQTTLSRQV